MVQSRLWQKLVLFFAIAISQSLQARATFKSTNFSVTSPHWQWSRSIALYSEKYRKNIALYWLQKELPTWDPPCPIEILDAPLKYEAKTRIWYDKGGVVYGRVEIAAMTDHLLTDTLPHEISHLVVADYFGSPVPRWADEGMAIQSESLREQNVYHDLLTEMMSQSLPWSLDQLFAMAEYPKEEDIFSFYGEAAAIVRWLIRWHGRTAFLKFVADGMQAGWEEAVQRHFQLPGIQEMDRKFFQSFSVYK